MTPSNATEVESPERAEILGQNDMVHTQLQTLMKFFVEHRNEMARKHELAEEHWEDKLVKDAATHNMLERILENQTDIMGKFATFKDEVSAEFQKIRVPNADHGIPEPPSLDPGPRAPSRSSSPTQGPTTCVPPRQPGVLPPTVIPATVTPNGNSTGHHLPPDLEPITIGIPPSPGRSPSPAHATPPPATIIPATHLALHTIYIDDLAHHTIDPARHTVHVDLAHRMTRIDFPHHTSRIDTDPAHAHHMMCVTDRHVETTTVHPVRVMIHTWISGDVVHVFGRSIDIAHTMVTMSTMGLALTLPNIVGVGVGTVHTEVAHGIRGWVTDPLVPILVLVLPNTWTDFIAHGILLGVPALEVRNTRRIIIVACSVAAIPPSTGKRTVILLSLHTVHRALAVALASLSLRLACPRPAQPFGFRQAQATPGGQMQNVSVKSALPMRQSTCAITRPSIYKTQKRGVKNTTVRMRTRSRSVFLSKTRADGTEMRDNLANPLRALNLTNSHWQVEDSSEVASTSPARLSPPGPAVPQAENAASMGEATSRYTEDIGEDIPLKQAVARAEHEHAHGFEHATKNRMHEEHW
ncbi:hypothetical protein V8D89_013344 [Ganoderma adspersum]